MSDWKTKYTEAAIEEGDAALILDVSDTTDENYGTTKFATLFRPYAEFHILEADAAATGTITPGTPVKIAGTATAGEASGFTIATTSGGRATYTGTQDGVFLVYAGMSVTCSANNTLAEIFLAKNGSIIADTQIKRKISTGTDVGAAGTLGLVPLSENDYLEVFVDVDSSATITAETLTFTIIQA